MKLRIAMICLCLISGSGAAAQHPADSLKLLLPITKSDTIKVWLLRDIAYYVRGEQPDSALKYSKRGAALARSLDFPEGEVRNLYQTALAYERKDELDSAFSVYRAAIEVAGRSGRGRTKVDMLNAAGVAYYYAGRLTEAVQHYGLAYIAADSLGYGGQKGHALNNMGVIYRMQGRHDEALAVYRKSLQIKQINGDSAGVVNALYNIGLAESLEGRFEESLEALLRAENLARQLAGQEVDLANLDLGIGVAYFNLGHKDLARGYLEKGLAFAEAVEPHTHAMALAYVGALNVDEGRHEQGMAEIEEAYAFAKNAGRLELLLQITRERAFAAEKVGNQALVGKSWRSYSQLADSLRSRDIRRLREEMQARFELKDKEITIAGQQWQIEQELLRGRRARMTAIALLLLALGCGALAMQLRRRAAQLRLAVADRERALEDNELLLREMHHRTKNNLQLLHSVFNLHRRATENEGAREVLKAGSESVEAIGLLHHHLYRSGDFRKVNIRPFLTDLIAYFKDAFSLEERGIGFGLSCPDIEVDIDVAVPLGIVINELSTNALKYAFENTGHARIDLSVEALGNRLGIEISDNGKGDSGVARNPGTGSRLVDLFGKKLGAELTRKSDESGTSVRMEFEIPSPR